MRVQTILKLALAAGVLALGAHVAQSAGPEPDRKSVV